MAMTTTSVSITDAGDKNSSAKHDDANTNNNNNDDYIVNHERGHNSSKHSVGPSDSSNLTFDDSINIDDEEDDQLPVDEHNGKNNFGGEVIDVEEEDLVMDPMTSSQHSLYSNSKSFTQQCLQPQINGTNARTIEELTKKVSQHDSEIQVLHSIITDLTNQVEQLQRVNQQTYQSQPPKAPTNTYSLGQRNRSLSSLTLSTTPAPNKFNSRPSVNNSATIARPLSGNLSTPRSYSSLHASPARTQNQKLMTYRRAERNSDHAYNTMKSVGTIRKNTSLSTNSPSQCSEDDAYQAEGSSQHEYPISMKSKSSRASSVSNLSMIAPQNRSISIADLTSQLVRGAKNRDIFFDLNSGVVRLALYGTLIQLHIPTRIMKDYTPNQLIEPPQARLRLSWVHGYRGRDCRSNLHYLPTGECLYFVGNVVVLNNIEDRNQRHYLGHTRDIRCVAIHPNKLTVATGQSCGAVGSGNLAQIRVWNSASLATLQVIEDLASSVLCLAFSKLDGGAMLASVDDSNDHTISLWNWQNGDQLAVTRDGPDICLAVDFHPIEHYKLITCGKNHIHFWDTEGFTLTKRSGLYEGNDKPKFVLCLTFNESGDSITGDSNGSIVIWPMGSNRPERFVEDAHRGGVFAILQLNDGLFLTGGGKDRRIVEWDSDLIPTGREAELPDMYGGVRALSLGKKNNILVGTTRNCLLQGNMDLGFFLIMQGQIEPMHALAVHPTQDQYIIGGQDCQLHLFDSISHSIVWTKCMQVPVFCAAFSPDSQILVVGSEHGQWNVVDVDTHEVIFACCDGTPQNSISCVKFSPSSQLLALGSSNGVVYIYSVGGNQFSRVGACIGHKSAIKHIDWSTDSLYMQTQGANLEILIWKPVICRPLSNISIERNIQWATHNCTVGFNVLGLWQDPLDKSFFTDCDRTNDHTVLASASDSGTLRLYRWPADTQHSLHHTFLGPSQRTDMIRFLANDGKLIAIGSNDGIISEWNVDLPRDR